MDENTQQILENSRIQERKEIKNKLDQALQDIAKQINEDVSLVNKQGNPLPLVNQANRIEMRSFYTKVGGPHSKTEGSKIQDVHLVQKLEKDFAQADDFSEPQKRLEQWRESRDLDDARLAESVITILLHKALGPEYLVMKSSLYDDYMNGIDTIIFDKFVGEIVCVFDEFLESKHSLSDERYKQKIAHVAEAGTEKSGINIKYGLTADVVSEQYILTAIQDVPLICLKINNDALHKLLQQYSDTTDSKADIELSVLKDIIDDIEKQKKEILMKSAKYKAQSNIEEIDRLLKQLQTHFQ